MLQSADAVVIGGGAFGASTAYHLARAGRKVALVDKFEIGSQTSPRAAGLTLQSRPEALMTQLAMRSVEKFAHFADEAGVDLACQRSGSIKLARTPEYAAQIRDDVRRGQALGLDIEEISPTDARQLAPFLDPTGALALWYTRSDLYLEPGDLLRAYARAAERFGVTLEPNTPVTAIGTRDGAIERVVTPRDEIRTPVVVDAAGAWTRVVAEMTGIHIPIVPTRHQLYITRPLPGVQPEQPIVRVLDVNVYVRPAGGGLMLGGYEPDPVQVDGRALPPDFQIADLALDFAPLRRLTEAVRDQFPALLGAEIAEFRGGLPTMTADGRHIVDRVPGVEGFYVLSGCCVGGLSISPAIGEVLASWIVDGEPPVDLSPFRLTRFGPELGSEERLRQDCLWRYAHYYANDVDAS
jgi:glycine/D-amino acid oxidase-like deaminating enzyme